jgi:diguanylate cyclase (GGDEF)-like protein/PAS domain S-box-containing protein
LSSEFPLSGRLSSRYFGSFPAFYHFLAIDVAYSNITDFSRKIASDLATLIIAGGEMPIGGAIRMDLDFSFRDIVELAQDVVIVTRAEPLDSPGPEIVYVNPAFTRLTGYSAAEAIGQNPRILQGEKTNKTTCHEIRQSLDRSEPIHVAILDYTKDGRQYWLDLSIMPLLNKAGEPAYFVAIERDVTLQKELENKLKELAERDPLTGLYNRRIFFESLDTNWEKFRSEKSIFSLLEIDIDHFKQFNDQFGHDIGDGVLAQISKIIQAHCQGEMLAARTGGEEFSMILPGIAAPEAFEIAEKLRQYLMDNSLEVDKHRLEVRISIGVSEALTDDIDVKELIRRADKALYQAKANGRNLTVLL